MKYTFSIHGVPYGSQSWGDSSDSEYLKSFYNSVSASNVPTQMIVDIRYSGNTICSYYHYLILSNVVDYESRPGSYFGMTICFEGVFCSDFVELYKLFDACFKNNGGSFGVSRCIASYQKRKPLVSYKYRKGLY